MTLTLFHHPFSRAGNTVWALEEIGEPYALAFVDILGIPAAGRSSLP